MREHATNETIPESQIFLLLVKKYIIYYGFNQKNYAVVWSLNFKKKSIFHEKNMSGF